MNVPLSEQYARQADEAERSAAPTLLKILRAVVWFFYAVVVVQVVLLLVAFVLRLLGASTDASFTQWVYRSADRSMEPFRGIFPSAEVGEASVLDTSLLFAAVVYVAAAFLIDLALHWISSRLAARDREVQALRLDAHRAAVREYEAAQRLLTQQVIAQQAAAAAAAATRSHEGFGGGGEGRAQV